MPSLLSEWTILHSALVVIVLLLFLGYRLLSAGKVGGRGRRSKILLLGISGSGKTAFLGRLSFGESAGKLPTVPSMKRNIVSLSQCQLVVGDENVELVDRALTVVDVPGHARMRNQFINYLNETKQILFFIDSTSSQFNANLPEVADYLYRILSNGQVIKADIPVDIICNKQDSLLAMQVETIRTQLESELGLLRETRTKSISMQQQQSNEDDGMYLGFEGKEFEFEDLETRVHFHATSLDKCKQLVSTVILSPNRNE